MSAPEAIDILGSLGRPTSSYQAQSVTKKDIHPLESQSPIRAPTGTWRGRVFGWTGDRVDSFHLQSNSGGRHRPRWCLNVYLLRRKKRASVELNLRSGRDLVAGSLTPLAGGGRSRSWEAWVDADGRPRGDGR